MTDGAETLSGRVTTGRADLPCLLPGGADSKGAADDKSPKKKYIIENPGKEGFPVRHEDSATKRKTLKKKANGIKANFRLGEGKGGSDRGRQKVERGEANQRKGSDPKPKWVRNDK